MKITVQRTNADISGEKNSGELAFVQKGKRLCLYGGFVHTVFANDMDYKKKYEAMKMDLVEFIESDVEYSETFEFYHMFTSKY